MRGRRSKRLRSPGSLEWFRLRREAREANKAPPSLAKLPAPWQVLHLAAHLSDKSMVHAAMAWLLTRPQAWMQNSLIVRFAICMSAIVVYLLPFSQQESKKVVLGDQEFIVAREIVLQAAETCPGTLGLAAAVKTLNDRGISLRLQNLSRCELPGAILKKVDLEGGNLLKIDLSHADLEDGNLRSIYALRAWFVQANLRRTDFSKANLFFTNFSGADMSEGILSQAEISFAKFSHTTLDYANLEGASLVRSDLSNASLIGADLAATDLTNANLEGATLDGSTIEEAVLCNTIMPDGSSCHRNCVTGKACPWLLRY